MRQILKYEGILSQIKMGAEAYHINSYNSEIIIAYEKPIFDIDYNKLEEDLKDVFVHAIVEQDSKYVTDKEFLVTIYFN